MKTSQYNEPLALEKMFQDAYIEYQEAIFRFCMYQTSNREIALDITQDTFCKVWDYLSKGTKVDNLRAFLYQVARNAIIDYRRKKKSESLDLLAESGFDPSGNDHEKIGQSYDIGELLARMETLPEKYRDVLRMRYLEDKDIGEIAKILDEADNTISVRIHRGIEQLRKTYE